ncbi:hypothetical protein TorRG33x02_004930 [Trema orientale]|uniref:Uncharacterized protein n=1 Tax=Trema orientale TaxID=63057 RepID=A0A2P5G2E6_TREOI|nr:hypothetical protein TorRG33x02_004930 [Trema orientale]
MGLSSCVVFASEINDKETYDPLFYYFLLKCDVCIKTSEGDERHLKFEEYINAFGKHPISTHILMWHFDDFDNEYLSSAKEVSFDFAPVKKDEYGLDFEVKKCGIHMLILQDAITWLSSTICMKLSKFHGFTFGGLSLFAATNLSTSEFEFFLLRLLEFMGCKKQICFREFLCVFWSLLFRSLLTTKRSEGCILRCRALCCLFKKNKKYYFLFGLFFFFLPFD